MFIEYLADGRAKIVYCDNDSWYRAHIQQAGRDARGRYIIYSCSLGFVICPRNIDIDDMFFKVFFFKIKKKSFSSGRLKWLVVNSLLLSEAFYATLGKKKRGRTQIIINVFFGPSSAAKISITAWLTVDKGCWWNHPSYSSVFFIIAKRSFLDGIMLVLLSIFIDLHCPWLLSGRARYYLLVVGSSAVSIDWLHLKIDIRLHTLIWINLCHLVIMGYTWNTVSCQKKMKKIKIEHNFSDGVLLYSVASMICSSFLPQEDQTHCMQWIIKMYSLIIKLCLRIGIAIWLSQSSNCPIALINCASA